MVALDLDGQPTAQLPLSVAENTALRIYTPPRQLLQDSASSTAPAALASYACRCHRRVTSKHSKRIVAKLALAGPSDTTLCVKHNLMHKLGLVPKKGPVLAEAVATYNALFSQPLPPDHAMALSSLFPSSLHPTHRLEYSGIPNPTLHWDRRFFFLRS
ncbi:Os12g0221100 [Oryza sativa Japonica Group]|nr:Os12g0221100 [Oryza sativa Japonica Group]